MKYKLTFIAVLVSFTVYCQLPADSMYSIIQQRSIYSNKADWNVIEKNFKSKLQNAKTDIDTIKAFISIFERLGDVHSNISYNNKTYSNYPTYDDTTLKKLMPLVAKSQQQNGIIKTSVVEKNYGYIQIPGIQAWGQKTNEYAQAIADSICWLAAKKVKGYIIDLRLNSGGQLSAMLSGLNLLLGNTYLGGGVNSYGTETNRFEILKNNFCINAVQMTAIKNKCDALLSSKPVVVLIGPATISSGSISAIAFKGRPATLFIGEPTADGYTTGNDYFYFTPTLSLNLSTSYSQDRNKIIYKNSVEPEVVIKDGDDFDRLINDKKVKKAIEWMKSKQ